jgi:hypothetical protein
MTLATNDYCASREKEKNRIARLPRAPAARRAAAAAGGGQAARAPRAALRAPHVRCHSALYHPPRSCPTAKMVRARLT